MHVQRPAMNIKRPAMKIMSDAGVGALPASGIADHLQAPVHPGRNANVVALAAVLCDAGEGDGTGSAVALLDKYGSIGAVLAAGFESLRHQIGETAATRLDEFNRLIQIVLREQIVDRPLIDAWDALELYLLVGMRHDVRERLRILFLDDKNRLIRDEVVQEGTVDHVPAYPREITKRALELNASAIILAHSHSSGDPTPSRTDVQMTKEVAAALRMVGIALHDHAIVGSNRVASMRRLKMM